MQIANKTDSATNGTDITSVHAFWTLVALLLLECELMWGIIKIVTCRSAADVKCHCKRGNWLLGNKNKSLLS